MFEDLKQEMAELKQRMNDRGRELFKDTTTDLFANDPELESFSWTQYTPYWNDGEPCYFGVNDYLEMYFTDGTYEEDVHADFFTNKYYEKQREEEQAKNPVRYETMRLAATLVREMPEEVMEDIFGDHVKVIVTKGGVEVEEYEHE